MAYLVTADEIKQIRTKYGLSQKDFALLLGIGPASIARYESGAKPTRGISNLIRAANNPQFVKECLCDFQETLWPCISGNEEKHGERSNKLNDPDESNQLPLATKKRIQKVVYAMVSLDEKGQVTDMTEMYEITLQQEVLNERVANMLAEIDREIDNAIAAGDETTASFLDMIAHDVAVLKLTIATEETFSNEAQRTLRAKFDTLEHLAKYCIAKAA